jgi:hypothetical protein
MSGGLACASSWRSECEPELLEVMALALSSGTTFATARASARERMAEVCRTTTVGVDRTPPAVAVLTPEDRCCASRQRLLLARSGRSGCAASRLARSATPPNPTAAGKAPPADGARVQPSFRRAHI